MNKNFNINTLVLENINVNHHWYNWTIDFKRITINNLVLVNNQFVWKNNFKHLFDNIDKDQLNALTFINFSSTINHPVTFEWNIFSRFIKLKAIHIESTQLSYIENNFIDLPQNSITSLTLINNSLKSINNNSFVDFNNLKMLIIKNNFIEKLDWITESLSNVWHLDLRNNRIKEFTENIAQNLVSLKVLKLGGNQLLTINTITIGILFNRLTEFSLLPTIYHKSKGKLFLSYK